MADWRARIRKRLIEVPPTWIAAALGAVLLGVPGLFGGLQDADKGLPPISPGDPVDVGPFTVQVGAVTAGESLPGMKYRLDKGNRWIGVAATVVPRELVTRDTVLLALTLRDTAPEELMLVRDGSPASGLNPGLREQVRFLWQQPTTQPVPRSADVVVRQLQFHRDETSQVWVWGRPTPVGALTGLPVGRTS